MKDFERVHRATPLLQFWTTLLALLAVVALNFGDELVDLLGPRAHGQSIPWVWLGAGLGGFVLLCALVWLVSGIWWRAMGYQLGEEEVALKHGVISKSLRTARYDRIQAVDVVEDVLCRIFRVAKVRIETAGGGDSVLVVHYLPKPVAYQVRAEVLRRRAGSTNGSMPSTAGRVLPETDEQAALIPPIPISRSLAAAFVGPHTLWTLLWFAVTLWMPDGWRLALPFLIGVAPAVWAIIDRSWNFTARLDEDVLNLQYGLADLRKQSIPLARVHGIELSQPWYWRPLGWWQVRVSIAGYANDKKHGGTTTFLPVGPWEQAHALAVAISPVRAAELTQTRPTTQWVSPERAKWVTPIDRAQQGCTLLDDRAVMLHSRRVGRRIALVDQSHIQELTMHRGLLDQPLRLAHVRLDLVPGPVRMTARQLDLNAAAELTATLRKRRLNAATA